MPKWECVSLVVDEEVIDKTLAAYGNSGWEPFAIVAWPLYTTLDHYKLYFKAPVESEDA